MLYLCTEHITECCKRTSIILIQHFSNAPAARALTQYFRRIMFTNALCAHPQISDDDRMSLTTAVSDEEDGESVMASPYKTKGSAASFNCTGAVRKAG